MAKKVLTLIKLQIPAAAANPAPPVGPALGQHGVNIMEFCKAFNAKTQQDAGTIIPVEITVYEVRSFDFITKTPPAAVLIKEAAGIEKGSGEPHLEKVGSITVAQAQAIDNELASDENRDVLAETALLVENVAAQARILLEHARQRVRDRARFDRNLGAIEEALKIRCKRNRRHGHPPRA